MNRENLSESLPLVLKKEYGCHRRDMIRTELCLSVQLETSASASEIIQELHQVVIRTGTIDALIEVVDLSAPTLSALPSLYFNLLVCRVGNS